MQDAMGLEDYRVDLPIMRNMEVMGITIMTQIALAKMEPAAKMEIRGARNLNLTCLNDTLYQR